MSLPILTIQSLWESFEQDVCGVCCDPDDMRRAFYAGARAMLSIIDRLSENDITEAEMMNVMEYVHDELDWFVLHLKEEVPS